MAPGTDLSSLASEIGKADNTILPQRHLKIPANFSTVGATVLHPSLVTKDFDALRFEAATLLQLDITSSSNKDKNTDASVQPSDSSHLSTLLISSPYNEPQHYLNLLDLDTSNRLFAKALAALQPIRADYATETYTEVLNLTDVVSLLQTLAATESFRWKETSFYVVVFRSKLKTSIDSSLLYQLDFESHREACESGGLLKYWFGKADGERQNMATCK